MRRRCLLPVPDHGATLGGAKGGLWELDEKKRALPPDAALLGTTCWHWNNRRVIPSWTGQEGKP